MALGNFTQQTRYVEQIHKPAMTELATKKRRKIEEKGENVNYNILKKISKRKNTVHARVHYTM
jgi:hypothetical protein